MTRARRRIGAALGIVALALAACATATPDPASGYLAGHAAAARAGRPFVPATEAVPGLDMDQAYALQRRLVAAEVARGDRVAGYKGGLMSQKSLTDRGVREPLIGALFASGESRGEVSLCGYRAGIFEMKLGYVFDAPVTRRLETVAELKSRVRAVQPVVELPDIAYQDPTRYGALDMVAANITAARYVRGVAAAPGALDLDALQVRLTRDGQAVAQGYGRESLGGQWESLLTLVNLIVERGGAIRPGQFVITGKIGDKAEVTPGAYAADYGVLGVVSFQVRPCADSARFR